MRKLKANEILVLRSCGAGGASERNFVWPLTVGAVVEAPDWQDTDDCGHGLHGLPWAQGGNYCDNSAPVWLVLRVSTVKGNYQHGTGNMIDKCKFRACTIEGVFDNSKDATDMILKYAPAGTVANYCMLKGGYGSTLTGGDGSTLCWRVWDGSLYRLHVRYTGEDGIEAGKGYRYESGQIVEVTR